MPKPSDFPRKPTRKERRDAQDNHWAKAEWVGPLDFYVSEDKWDELDALVASGEVNLAEWLQECCEAGLKFSLVMTRDENFVATLYCAYARHEFAGISISAFSNSALDAMHSLWFKHVYLGQRDFAVLDQLASGRKSSKRG